MGKPSNDPSAEHEPHFQKDDFKPDPSEERADRTLHKRPPETSADHSVWEEPTVSEDLAGSVPESERLTFAAWLSERQSRVTPRRSWLVMGLIVLLSGPWAMLGTFLGSGAGETIWNVLILVVFGPVLEEAMKVGAAFYVVERRPYLVRSPSQLVITALASAFFFAAVENVLYIYVYIPNPTPGIIQWRWTVCVALHMGCSLIAVLGVVRVWNRCMRERRRPDLERGVPYLIAAATVHGLYNGLALILAVSQYKF